MSRLEETQPGIDAAGDDAWTEFSRPTPQWFAAARFGIFIHWGAYSVPAWAEPTGALGLVPEEEWFIHNAYAEWYWNTIRIPGSPAAGHHAREHDGRPYDDFLDRWRAEEFDPSAWARLFAEAGARYVVPTTKHHDGIALWDAPGTGARNTVHRGPRRDLIGDIAEAVRKEGMRFGVYYSGGLDWGVSDLPPIMRVEDVQRLRPNDPAYATYAYLQVVDLVRRHEPDVLWNDINWPDVGKRRGAYSLHELLHNFYAANPDGVINDRWGNTHWDFRTSEYSYDLESESAQVWENCRGIGFSFGYNQAEGPEQSLTGGQAARHLVDVASRGGRFLLNVGPTSSGRIPDLQQRTLADLASWNTETGGVVHHSSPTSLAQPSDEPWVRWLQTPRHTVAMVGTPGRVELTMPSRTIGDAQVLGARGRVARSSKERVVVDVDSVDAGPVAVRFTPSRG